MVTEFNAKCFSFHVGSGCLESAAFSRAISAAKSVFSAAARLGVRLQLLDIGGGFPGHEAECGDLAVLPAQPPYSDYTLTLVTRRPLEDRDLHM